jgi:hypothetical protein
LPAKTRQFYHPDTNVLITRFSAQDGVGEIQDFMPVAGAAEARRHRRLRQPLIADQPHLRACSAPYARG